MARIIVRYSFHKGQPQIGIRNRVRATLSAAGFTSIGTATWEGTDLDLADGLAAVADVLRLAGTGRLDNLWVYADQPGAFTAT